MVETTRLAPTHESPDGRDDVTTAAAARTRRAARARPAASPDCSENACPAAGGHRRQAAGRSSCTV